MSASPRMPVQAAYLSAWRELRSLRDPDRFETLAAPDPGTGVLRGGPSDATVRRERPGPPGGNELRTRMTS